MPDQSRIDDLRRRVQKDPSSIAFAQLAEECRRAGRHQEAVDVCHAGLAIHPGYLSARVTLGRALIELNSLDEAQTELELVLKSASENLAAIRGLAEIHHRRGSLVEALGQYRRALELARNDPDLQRTVADLERLVEPPKPLASDDGLSFELLQSEFLQHLPPPPPPPPPKPPAAPPAAAAVPESRIENLEAGIREQPVEQSPVDAELRIEHSEPGIPERIPSSQFLIPGPDAPALDRPPNPVADEPAPEPRPSEDQPPAHEEPPPAREERPPSEERPAPGDEPPLDDEDDDDDGDEPSMHEEASTVQFAGDTAERERALNTIAALEQWLGAIHVARTQPGA